MAEPTLNKCQGQSNKRACEGSWPWSSANDHSCELNLLKPNKESNCKYQLIVESKSYWVELEKKISWLIKVQNQSKART